MLVIFDSITFFSFRYFSFLFLIVAFAGFCVAAAAASSALSCENASRLHSGIWPGFYFDCAQRFAVCFCECAEVFVNSRDFDRDALVARFRFVCCYLDRDARDDTQSHAHNCPRCSRKMNILFIVSRQCAERATRTIASEWEWRWTSLFNTERAIRNRRSLPIN